MSGFWQVPKAWKGQTAAILAGGPSLTDWQIEQVRQAPWRCITINESFRRAPWADIHYFCDARWHERVKNDPAWLAATGMRVTLENLTIKGCRHLKNYQDPEQPFVAAGDGVFHGRNSGYQALHLAALLGASTIVLLGYDMRLVNGRSHWHDAYTNAASTYENTMRPFFPALAKALKARGVRVLNATPGSALDCFERADLASLLPDPEPAALSA